MPPHPLVSPGVFVGIASAQLRELAWQRVAELSKDGRAIMIHSTKGEQRLVFKVHRHDWQFIDFDGIRLMCRPRTSDVKPGGARAGWSKASRYHRAAKSVPSTTRRK
jgi:CRISPR-associated protein Cas2